MKNTPTSLNDFSNDGEWLAEMPSSDEFDYAEYRYHFLSGIHQQRLPSDNNKIFSIGHASDFKIRLCRKIASFVLEETPSTPNCAICGKILHSGENKSCCRCSLIIRMVNIHHVGQIRMLPNNILTNPVILTFENHLVFCVQNRNQYDISVICKSITESKWKHINDDYHLDIPSIDHGRKCYGNNRCNCKKLSTEIYKMNLIKYTIFKEIDLPKDVIGVIMNMF